MAGLEYPACVTYKVTLQHGGFVPFSDHGQLMAESGQGQSRQLISLKAKQAIAIVVSHLLHQSVMQFTQGMQVTLIVTVHLADFCHILTGIIKLT